MPVKVTKDEFGVTTDGTHIARYTLKNSSGMMVQVIELGAAITSILVPDKHGEFDDVTPGFDTVAEYEVNRVYLGAVVGRTVNRITNAKFTLDDTEYQLSVNAPPNHLHGGLNGFHQKVWQCRVDECNRLLLTLDSADGDEGYPGTLHAQVSYQLTDDNAINIHLTATVDDKPTIVNLTNHAYFNLAGHDAVDVYDHEITVNAESYLVKTADLAPSGEVADVAGSPYDLRSPTLLRDTIHDVFAAPGIPGFDHTYCLNRGTGDSAPSAGDSAPDHAPAATLFHRDTGRLLHVFTDQRALQFYTGNFLDGIPGKLDSCYGQHSSLSLETQNYPDSINHASFPSCVLRPGDTYRHHCCYKFSVVQ